MGKKSESLMMKTEQQLNKVISEYIELRDKYLAECTATGTDPDPSLLGVEFFNGTVKSIREAILLSVSPVSPTTVTDIFNRARSMGIDCLEISIRNEISKLKKEGLLLPVGHGSYLRAQEIQETVNA